MNTIGLQHRKKFSFIATIWAKSSRTHMYIHTYTIVSQAKTNKQPRLFLLIEGEAVKFYQFITMDHFLEHTMGVIRPFKYNFFTVILLYFFIFFSFHFFYLNALRCFIARLNI